MQVDQPPVEYVQVYSRRYRITATFTDMDEANRYMAAHRDEGVIAEREGLIYIVKLADQGIPAH